MLPDFSFGEEGASRFAGCLLVCPDCVVSCNFLLFVLLQFLFVALPGYSFMYFSAVHLAAIFDCGAPWI